MHSSTNQYLEKAYGINRISAFVKHTWMSLSLIVILIVFWWLKLTGITMAGEAFCGMTEHTHDETCGMPPLVCTLEETEGHVHDDTCLTKNLICELTEAEGHTHGEGCYTATLICTLDEIEGHVHGDTCKELTVICELEENEEHTHGEECKKEEIICTLAEVEGHIHGEECYSKNLTCEIEAVEGHVHGETCYVPGTEYGCGLTECEPHVHKEECYGPAEECVLVEHIHIESCYSNIEADVETSDDWEKTFADIIRREKYGDTLIEVARSQLGYKESELNFQVDEFGLRHGYTRYGEWYGNPYGDWANMFTSFCLEYAGVMEIPISAGAETMLFGTEEAGLYRNPLDYIPIPGDILFLDKNLNKSVETTAIITAVDETTIYVIEGDFENAVAETSYLKDDGSIVGYGIMPDAKESGIGLFAERASATYTVWLDGTLGGTTKAHAGSNNEKKTVNAGETITLPTEFQSPTKYDYKVQGWYDVVNSKYYKAGAQVKVDEDLVFYADWVPRTYDIGKFDEYTCTTVDSSDFITTHLFDYNYLFNVMSTKATVNVNANSHSENWSMVGSGNVPYKDMETLDFIFQNYSTSNGIIHYPNNMTNNNTYKDTGTRITSGIFDENLKEVLFGLNNSFNPDTGEGIIGKTYVGPAEYLMQYSDDPNSEYYGYYYYDAQLHAASYNQSAKRFYVYDYLAATSDTRNARGSELIADFLPFNSPYANINEDTVVGTYTHNGKNNEYVGTTHYYYESDYSSNNNRVATNFSFGMSSAVKFHLPNKPGETDANGEYGNRDLYGREMVFEFFGDDDVWVTVDDQLILDLGGIHQSQQGEINFSQGYVSIDGTDVTNDAMKNLDEGEHVLTVYYLDRGGSMSNCAFFYNISPRLSLSIQKEDVLTQKLLDSVEFSIYKDILCTEPAMLWPNEESYNNGENPTNKFTVTNGTVDIWGFSSGKTYYIKETKPPNEEKYSLASGLIKLAFDKEALTSYNVEIINEVDANGVVTAEVSKGYTVHGTRIDENAQKVYLKVTNAQDWVTETTTVQVIKEWEDTKDHSNDSVKVYLTVTEADGTRRRIREIDLSEKNNWSYIWTGLPKYAEDQVTEIKYGVDESYESGYYSTSQKIQKINIEKSEWGEAYSFEDGVQYLLKNKSDGKCLATESSSSDYFEWITEHEAKNSSLALWTAKSDSSGKYKFTNGAGQTLTLISSNGYKYQAVKGNSTYQSFTIDSSGNGLKLYIPIKSNSWWQTTTTNYYVGSRNGNGTMRAETSSGNGITFIPMKLVTKTEVQDIQNLGFKITNTPLKEETSLTVYKNWQIESGDVTKYQEYQVTVRLFANGVDTDQTVTLSLRNGWTNIFQGLPYRDANENVIQYTVREDWTNKDWRVSYGEVEEVDSNSGPPTYRTTLTNTYQPSGPLLPSTGSMARMMFTMCGGGAMLTALGIGILLKRKKG